MPDCIKVLLVDDHESMRNLFEYEFCPENGFEVVASIAAADLAVAECRTKSPDLVVLDVCTEGGASGLDAAETIRALYPDIKIILTSGFEEITYAPRAKALGAHAFVYKSNSCAYFRTVARRVLAGEYVFPEPKTIPMPQGESPLTEREMEILRLKCRHMTASEIAEALFISEKTVHRHIENILEKTGMASMLEVVVYVLSNGWINPNF